MTIGNKKVHAAVLVIIFCVVLTVHKGDNIRKSVCLQPPLCPW